MKKLLILASLIFAAGHLIAQCPGPGSRTALINLQKSTVVEGTLAWQFPMTDDCGNLRYNQFVEVENTPVGFIPTPTGNTSNFSEFVIGSDSSRWYIDAAGRGFLLDGGAASDRNGYYGGNGGNGGDGTIPSVTKSTLTNQLTLELDEDDAGGLVPFRIEVDAGNESEFQSFRQADDSLLIHRSDQEFGLTSTTGLNLVADDVVTLLGDSIGLSGVLTESGTSKKTFLTIWNNNHVRKKLGVDSTDLNFDLGDFSVNIFNSNGTLTSNRTLAGDNKNLIFSNLALMDIATNGAFDVLANGDMGLGAANVAITSSANSSMIAAGGVTVTGATSANFGTSGANPVTLSTNGVTRVTITGDASTGGAVTVRNVNANTNTAEDVMTLNTSSTGTPAANFGQAILFQGESSTTDNRDMSRITSTWTTATDASRTSKLGFQIGFGGAAIGEMASFSMTSDSRGQLNIGTAQTLIITPAQITTATGFTIGNSGSSVTLSCSNTLTNNITLVQSGNGATTTGGINIGNNISFTQTSGTRNYINCNWSFAPTSGTAEHNQISFNGTLNQTGGAAGIVRGINLAHTVTAVADYRAIEIADNGSNVKAIYQTGPNAVNNLAGPTNIGSINAPVASTPLTIEYASANTTTPQNMNVFRANSSGSVGNGFGPAELFQGESSTTDNQDMVSLEAIWTDATHATRTSAFVFRNVSGGGALTERFRFSPTGMILATAYTLGGSASTVTVGGSSGAVSIFSTAASTTAINIEANSTGTTNGVAFGTSNFNHTSGTKNLYTFYADYVPTSGTGVQNWLVWDNVVNQTGGASGITRNLYMNTTVTAAADLRCVEIAVNSASAKGIYQTGPNTVSAFVGPVGFGSTTTAVEAVEVTGNIELTTAGNKLMIATGADASIGTATMVAGTVTVSTTAVKTGSKIFLSVNTPGGTQGFISAPDASITDGTSFVINSSNALDTSTVNWWIIN